MSSLKRNLSDDDDDDHLSDDSPDKKKRQKSFESINSELKREFSAPSFKREYNASNLSDDEDTAPAAVKPKIEPKVPKAAPAPTTSKFDPMKMLVWHFIDKYLWVLFIDYVLKSKMGYKEGQGLGKNSQGITKPITESDQKGKQGLGFSTGKESEKVESWDFDKDPVRNWKIVPLVAL